MTSSPLDNDKEEKPVREKSEFTIDHILNRAGNYAMAYQRNFENVNEVPLPWLHCTRYCPPKIPRSLRKEVPQKRQLGRHPRIPFTSQQLNILEEKFRKSPYLSSSEVTKISSSLQLSDMRVKIWFQNRRARERRERAHSENEQSMLASSIDTNGTNSQLTCLEPPHNTLDHRNSAITKFPSQTLPMHLQEFSIILPNCISSVTPKFSFPGSCNI